MNLPELIATATATSILGVVGKAAGTVSKIGPVKDWLHGCKVRALAGRRTPHNHDLVKGGRTAHICALDHVARGYTKLLTTLPDHKIGSDDHAFANNLRAFIDKRLKILSDQNIDHDVLGADNINDVLEHLATATTHQSYADLNHKARIDCEDRALQEIIRDAGRTPPALFVRVFKGGNEGAGWYEAFSLFVTEELKTNERFRSIFFATELVDIRGVLNELVDLKRTEFPDLSGFLKDVKHQLRRMEDKLDRIQEAVDKLVTALAQNPELSKKLEAENIAPEKVMAIARRTALNINDPEQALKELESHAEIAIEIEKEGRGGSNLGEFVDAVLARVRERYDANDFDAAAEEADEGFAEWQQRDAEQRKESLQAGQKILEAGLKQDILRRNATSAASRIARRCELNHPDQPSDQITALGEAYKEWFERGRDAGLNFDLEIAIEIAVLLRDRASAPDQLGYWKNNLGNVLLTLGERESGTERLEQAVAVYLSALEELRQDRVALDWAMTQNNLGNALLMLGTRESKTERLEQAIAAYLSALKERTQDLVPLDWAKTQNNLGNALLALGERKSGKERLEQAITAFQSALEERTQDLVPLDWAMTQNNLGNALLALGERESGTKKLEQAIVAFKSALEEYKQDRVPLDWAMAQNNLGNALRMLGERESGTERLESAVCALKSALKERQQDRVPLYWATTQNYLGLAFLRLGERESGTETLEQAIAAFQSAIEEYRQADLPLYWAESLIHQASANRIIAERSSDLELATLALNQCATALKAFQKTEHEPNVELCKDEINKAFVIVTKLMR